MGCCNARSGDNLKEKSVVSFENVVPLSNDASQDETKQVDFKHFFKSTNHPISINGTTLNNCNKNGYLSEKLPEENIKKEDTAIEKEKENKDHFPESCNKNFDKDKPKETLNSTLNKKIPYPVLEINVFSNKNGQNTDVIKITPNSITSSQGCFVKQKFEKFSFGRASQSVANKNRNDYNFNDNSIGLRQFDISVKDDKFHVVDNKKGTGLFVKIQDKITVDHDMIVSFCSSHMILQVENDKEKLPANANDQSIRIRFLQGSNQKAEKCFNPKEKTQVRIGRSKDAEIVYKDDSVSRIQCTLLFEGGEWILYDGQLENGGNKSSTNGLW